MLFNFTDFSMTDLNDLPLDIDGFFPSEILQLGSSFDTQNVTLSDLGKRQSTWHVVQRYLIQIGH